MEVIINKSLLICGDVYFLTENQCKNIRDKYGKVDIIQTSKLITSLNKKDFYLMMSAYSNIIIHDVINLSSTFMDSISEYHTGFNISVEREIKITDKLNSNKIRNVIFIPAYKVFDVTSDYKEDEESVAELSIYPDYLVECLTIQSSTRLMGYDLSLKESSELFGIINEYFCTSCMGVGKMAIDVAIKEMKDSLQQCDRFEKIKENITILV